MTATTPPRRGRPRGFDRGQALQRATHTFWRHGYEATSIATLTEALGVSAPSLYAAFGDKQALFKEVVEGYSRSYGAFATRALAEEPTAREGVARLLREAAKEYTDPAHPPGCLIITAATNCGPGSAEIEELLRRQRVENVADLRRRIAADIAAGVLPADPGAGALARFSAATLQGMSQQARDRATEPDLLVVAETAMRAWPHPLAADHGVRDRNWPRSCT